MLLIDTNHLNIRAARMEGVDAVHANVLDEGVLDDLDLRGIGRAFAATPNEEVNTLVLQRFSHVFEKSGLYRLPPPPTKAQRRTAPVPPGGPTSSRSKSVDAEPSSATLGRRAFDRRANFASLEHHVQSGWVVKATNLSEEFTYEDFKLLYGAAAIPLLVISGTMIVVGTVERPIAPEAGDTVVALVDPEQLLIPALTDPPTASA